MDEYYADKDFAYPFITIPVVNPERTFLEKVFLLHEEFQKPAQIRVERLSRHLYDVVKLSRTDIVNQALEDTELYSTIVAHRFAFNQVAGDHFISHNPSTLYPKRHT